MTLVFSEIGMPRGRGKIERFFQTVSQGCLSALPGYTPPGTRPATPGMTLAALEERLRAFLLDDYHRRPHGETGEAPQARWEAGGFLPRLPDSLEHLDLLLLTVPTGRRVHQDGIHFQGLRYLDLTLAAYVGETVTVRYDPRDMAEVRVYHRDGFLCRAIAQELAGQEISLKELVRTRTERRRQLRADLDERRSVVDTYLAAHRPEPPRPAPTTRPPAAPSPQAAVADPPRLKRYQNE